MQRVLISLILILTTAAVLLVLFKGSRPAQVTETETNAKPEMLQVEIAPAPADTETIPPSVPAAELPPGARVVASKIPDERFTRLADGRSLSNEGYAAARELHRADLPPEEDLQQLNSILGLYQWAYKQVPEGGENYEIMAPLLGDNPHRVVFFPPDPERFDREGNLLDRWGTPYFFHKMSDQVLDIVSAGPDQRLWTADDLSLGLVDDYETASSD